ncbi:hypothetical protein os1_18910 [Comamonadaceae bacterium OS-1]|nr:hypothetical protein os1_18910 [Comamonadaceae bacterium OS-1]
MASMRKDCCARLAAWLGCVGLLALCVPVAGWAAASIQGFVYADVSLGSPIANVSISAEGQNRLSNSNGSFTLSFPQRKPGDTVRLVAQRSGLEVVNRYALEHTLSANPADRTVEIVMATSAQREEMAVRYFGLKGSKTVELQYQAKLAVLVGQNTATAQERARLQEERDSALKQVQELARQLATRTPSDDSPAYNQAIQLFLAGRIDPALEILSEEQLQKDGEKALAKLQKTIDGWLLRGKLLAIKLDLDGAARAYDKATALAPQDPNVWFQFAFFHKSQNHWSEARQGYDTALKLYRALALKDPDLYLPEVASILNNLGNLHSDENHMPEARIAYDEALKLNRELALKSPDLYLHYVAITLNNLGALYIEEDLLTEAHSAYDEALKIRRTLALKNPDVYLPDVASSLNNLGILYGSENHMPEAHTAYDEALKLYRELALKNPDVHLPLVATTLNNLGVLHNDESHMPEALTAFEEALTIRRTLALKNPDLYLPYVGNTLNNLGNLHSDEHRLPEARAAYDEALKLHRALAQKNPDVYLPKVANTLNNLGVLYRAQNDIPGARAAYEEALKILTPFAQRSATLRQDLERVQHNLNELN